MSFSIRTDRFELKAQCSIPSFHKRGELVTTLVCSAIEMALKYCEELSEDDIGSSHTEWKDREQIISDFLDYGKFQKWTDMVAGDLSEYGEQDWD
jgi:hypothetical protein